MPRIARLAIAVAVVALIAGRAIAQVPETLRYQGYLADSAGQPLDAAVNVTFSMYTAQTGGVPLWTDTRVVVPAQGLITTELGEIANPFPVGLFDTPLYLGVTVEGDTEMTPRVALSSAPYAHKAVDATTLGGVSATTLDQSADVAALQSDLLGTQTLLANATLDIAVLENDVTANEPVIDGLLLDVAVAQGDISILQVDLNAVEAVLPTLQKRVTGTCGAGSAIRTIDSLGGVTCEADDQGPWSANGSQEPYALNDVGIGTSSPTARLSLSDSDWHMTLANAGTGGNEWHVGSSADAWGAGGGKFVVSPTSGSGNAALVIDTAKNIGIGTTLPQTRLHIKGGSDVSPAGGGYVTFGDPDGSNIAIDTNEIMARSNGAPASLALNAEGGKVRINSNGSFANESLDIVGGVNITSANGHGFIFGYKSVADEIPWLLPTAYEKGQIGHSGLPFRFIVSHDFIAFSPINYGTYSDERIKRDVKPITGALATVEQLDGVTYELLDHPDAPEGRSRSIKEDYDRRNQLGFIAQDLEKVLPQLVKVDEDSGLKTVGYLGLVPVLVEAIKEQQRQIEKQQKRLDTQAAQIAVLTEALR